MKRRVAVSLTAFFLVAGAGLAACDPSDGGRTGAGTGMTAATTEKLATYTAAVNDLIGGTPTSYSGLTGRAEAYLRRDIASASLSDAIDLDMNPPWLRATAARLKQARAMTGEANMAPVDQAADTLIAHIETIMRIEDGLGSYYESRAYRQDGLARGKAADPELRQAYQNAMEAMGEMESALSVVQRQANDARIRHLTDRGYVAEASMETAMSKAELMVAAVLAEDSARGARSADELQTALEEMRTNKSRLKNKDDEDSYDLVLDSLTKALAGFRDLQAGDQYAAQLIVPFYNNAVQFTSNMSLPA